MIGTEPVETIHLYVVRDDEPPKPKLLPILVSVLAFLCLISTGFTNHATFPTVIKTIQVPAIPLPIKVFKTEAQIIPTGIKTYPATYAHGNLVIYNGSVLYQRIDKGMIFVGKDGIEAITDESVIVPAGNPPDYGIAIVPAHLLTSGIIMSTLSIDQIVGTALYVRNLQPFIGGRPAYSVKFTTPQDKELAVVKSRKVLSTSVIGFHYPCAEQVSGAITVTWRCQFITYHLPSYMHVTGIKILGKNLLVDVTFVVRPKRIWVR